MPTLSIEVLCVGASTIRLPDTELIGIDTTYPPKSDREPSLWQFHIDRVGGVLIHVFDPDRIGELQRWAYDIIVEEDWERFKFRTDVLPAIRNLLKSAIKQSPSRKIYFYTDAQWSNDPLILDHGQSFDSFSKHAEDDFIRMNTAYLITGDQTPL